MRQVVGRARQLTPSVPPLQISAMRVVILALLAAAAVATTVPFTDCSNGQKTHIKISSIDATPYPPVKGQPVTVSVSGSVDEQVVGGSYSLNVSVFGVQIFSQTGDICTLSPKFPCPFQQGPIQLQVTETIPGFAPSGTFEVAVSGTDQNTQLLMCVQVKIQIKSAAELPMDLSAPAIRPEIIETVNGAKNAKWVAGYNKRWDGLKLADAKRMCGAKKEIRRLPVRNEFVASLPTSFDSRSNWPNCSTMSAIRDQGSCGSCWAVSAAETMSDRVCVASSGSVQKYLSAEDILSCCGWFCGQGCQGGYPSSAWDYFQSTGVVTGGEWESAQGCYPYQIASCDHHVNGTKPPCGQEVPTPACARKCLDAGFTWSTDKNFGASAYSVGSSQDAIMSEIMKNGPVQAAFTVFEDFLSYKSGVYHHTTGQELGGHAVKILGWGVENNSPYWLVANSWNTDWGDQGYFKILRGVDECGIEDSIVAGIPKV
jgi:cathepsin B